MAQVRRLALKTLTALDRGGDTLAEILARSEIEALEERDRSFLHELVLGTLRLRGALDFALGSVCDRPMAKVDGVVLWILRLGAHQILNLRVPDHAAVSESVALAQRVSPRASGFVNASLRSLARKGAPSPPDAQSDPLGWLTTAGSLPRWLAERWLTRLGPSLARQRAEAFSRPPARAFRNNPRVANLPTIEARPSPVPGALVATADLPRHEGVYPQDEGSQLVAALLPEAARVWDCCAAPGGKTTALADRLPMGQIIATESSPARLQTLARLVSRWGAPNVRLSGADAMRPPFREGLPSILLDAPCSGLGTLGRHPDIRWRMKEADIPRHAEKQASLLSSVAALLAKGGHLVYATCSLEPEENRGVIEPFLDAHADFHPAPLPAWAASFAQGPYAEARPETTGGDGFFAALLMRD